MKLHQIIFLLIAISGLSFGYVTNAADIPLYPTGPSQDSAFVRFINGTDTNLSVTAGGSKAKVALDTQQPASQYYPVASKGSITGEFSDSQASNPICLMAVN